MKLTIFLFTIPFLATVPAMAQHAHSNQGGGAVIQTGQAQFEAITEIVTVLRNDPATDWESVDVQALRDHLVDMDNVTMRSTVVTNPDVDRVTFTIEGNAGVVHSIQRMVTAHSPMLAAETGWPVASALNSNGATMTVIVPDDADRNQVLGLGFFGLMTIGAHHQAHHLMIATGSAPH